MTSQVIAQRRRSAIVRAMSSTAAADVGSLIRQWRQHRRRSQMDLAGDAAISTRHLSFVETGRASPSREMVLKLAERLDVPLRERNRLLTAAGYAPLYRERAFDDPDLGAARQAVQALLTAHEPNPALAIDRHWQLLAANRPVQRLMEGIDASLLAPPLNVLRITLHPLGLAPRIANLGQWRAHLLARLHQQIEASADPGLVRLLDELRELPIHDPGRDAPEADPSGVMLPLQLRQPDGSVLSFIGTTTVFGTPVDITLAELALELMFPADAQTAQALRDAAGQDGSRVD
jgi:transcriptional regulator with XRE-family HTH domain